MLASADACTLGNAMAGEVFDVDASGEVNVYAVGLCFSYKMRGSGRVVPVVRLSLEGFERRRKEETSNLFLRDARRRNKMVAAMHPSTRMTAPTDPAIATGARILCCGMTELETDGGNAVVETDGIGGNVVVEIEDKLGEICGIELVTDENNAVVDDRLCELEGLELGPRQFSPFGQQPSSKQ